MREPLFTQINQENLPVHARVIHTILQFIQNIAICPTSSSTGQLIQHISFPRHHGDAEDYVPIKCKGFAFIIFSQASAARAFTEQWPWAPSAEMGAKCDGSPESPIDSARASGLRALSKRRWDTLKEEYIALQLQLRAKAVKSSMPHTRNRPLAKPAATPPEHGREEIEYTPHTQTMEMVMPVLKPENGRYSFPPDCLVFVKNVHAETNKTTLRTLFSKAFDGSLEEIDYVDYTKGLDSVSVFSITGSSKTKLPCCV